MKGGDGPGDVGRWAPQSLRCLKGLPQLAWVGGPTLVTVISTVFSFLYSDGVYFSAYNVSIILPSLQYHSHDGERVGGFPNLNSYIKYAFRHKSHHG